jgi:ribose 5-phosphate isomerase B
MKIAIANDHRGVVYKQALKNTLKEIDWVDVGVQEPIRSDFPFYAKKMVETIQDGTAQSGILLCSSGIGMSIAANRFKGIYAALVWNPEVAKRSKEHNNANVLVIPADFVSLETAVQMIRAWLEASFLEGRYQERIDLVDQF